MQDEASRRALLGCSEPRSTFEQVATVIAQQDNQLASLQCASGHNFLPLYGQNMARALFNVLTSNYATEVNSAIHSTKRRNTSPVVMRRRDQTENNVRNLSGAK